MGPDHRGVNSGSTLKNKFRTDECRGKLRRGVLLQVLLQEDNGPVHTSHLAMNAVKEKFRTDKFRGKLRRGRLSSLQQPNCNGRYKRMWVRSVAASFTDLAPSDYYLFTKLKKKRLRGNRYNADKGLADFIQT